MSADWWVSVLGVRDQQIAYTFAGETAPARLAPLALLDLRAPLGWRAPERILALCTEEAEDRMLPKLQAGCAQRGLDGAVHPVRITDEPGRFLHDFLGALPEQRSGGVPLSLTIDLTHGFRHLAILTYAAALYASSLRPLQVERCLYAKIEGDRGEFVDLTQLLVLPRWLHALQVLEDSGDALALAKLFARGTGVSTSASRAATRVSDFATVLNWRAPLDVAQAAAALHERRTDLECSLLGGGLPLAREVVGRLGSLVDAYRCDDVGAGRKKQAKPKSLTAGMLDQHGRMVAAAFERGDQAAAAALLSEWMISWAWWNLARGHSEWESRSWLSRCCRVKASRRLGMLGALAWDAELCPLLDADQRRVGRIWRDLSEVRNALMHNGMRPEWLLKTIELAEIEKQWTKWLSGCPKLDLRVNPTSGEVLVSSQGLSPGVLASAIRACHSPPDTVVCISSERARILAQASLNEVGFGGTLIVKELRDPRAGVEEIDAVLSDAQVRRCLACASLVQVNLTGGTSLMGAVTAGLVDLAGNFSVPVRRFVLLEPEREDPARPVWLAPPGRQAGTDG